MNRIEGTPRQALWSATLGFFVGFAAVALFGPSANRFQQVMGLRPAGRWVSSGCACAFWVSASNPIFGMGRHEWRSQTISLVTESFPGRHDRV